jgi:hypothetical protein
VLSLILSSGSVWIRTLAFRGDDFDADISVKILHVGEDYPTTRETLENLGLISQVTQQSIADIEVWIRTWWSWLANPGLVFCASAVSLSICSWFRLSQSWSFLSLWGLPY